ncbi:MAG: hypothetical protein AAGJ28_01355 [Pseudomonadota bacterium]
MFGSLGRRSRTLHIHVGPHKTGSTAIQRDLRSAQSQIAQATGLTPLRDDSIWELARALNAKNRDAGAIEAQTQAVVKACNPLSGDVLVSCEDLAGHLPGRSGVRHCYPGLWGSLNHLRKAFPKDDVRFYFFLRSPDAWLHSAYVQNLKHRTRFRSYDKYLEFLRGTEDLWDKVIERPAGRLGEHFITINYAEGPEFSAPHALVQAIAGEDAANAMPPAPARPNSAPSDVVIRLLEKANRSGASPQMVHAAKQSIVNGTVHAEPIAPAPDTARPDWPTDRTRPDWLSPELEALWGRVERRIPTQQQSNLMPALACDLVALRRQPVSGEEALPEVERLRMENQIRILNFRLRDQPQTCHLLAMVISYLRRGTEHTAHASHLFQRLWAEEYPVLLGFLETRWLISVLQTFMEHGVTDAQRVTGAAGFLFANTLKLYEAERALDGLAGDATYRNLTPATPSRFWGLDRLRVGGSDMALNTTAHLLELAAREERAGRVLQELLVRVKRYHTAFSRMDRTRAKHGVEEAQFADCWSFFEKVEWKG